MKSIKIFRYIESVDSFVVTDEYRVIAETLGLTEWHPAVWIGRLFILDNDYGEHWFDNWDLREAQKESAEANDLDPDELMIIDPQRFQNGKDGPCHTDDIRKRFWTDVLKSLELSYDLLFDKARQWNERIKEHDPEQAIEDLEAGIEKIKTENWNQEGRVNSKRSMI